MVTVILIMTGDFGTIRKRLERGLVELEVGGRIKTL